MIAFKSPIIVGYVRRSTGKQAISCAQQEAQIREFAAARALTIDAIFTETESGANDDRPQLAKALKRAKKLGGAVAVSTLSRLGRRVSFISRLMESGVPFVCADAPGDEPFILHLKAAWAEEERRKISERTRACLATLKAQGRTLGAPVAARLKGTATTKQRAAEANAALLPRIAALRAEGLGMRAVASRLGVSAMRVSRLLKR
jgi:DNA invertase Pin-like site-specific DNA recombinase